MTWTPTYSEFSDPRLVAIYDSVNPIGSYRDFYTELTTELEPNVVIDFGCGTGLLTRELASPERSVIGVEPSQEMLGVAAEKTDAVEWINAGVEAMSGLSADLVLMTGHVAQFFVENDQWVSGLRTIHRSLNRGGVLAFETRNPEHSLFGDWPDEGVWARFENDDHDEARWSYRVIESSARVVRYENMYQLGSDQEVIVSRNELVFRNEREIHAQLREAGFIIRDAYGDWNLNPVSPNHPEMIFVCEKSFACS